MPLCPPNGTQARFKDTNDHIRSFELIQFPHYYFSFLVRTGKGDRYGWITPTIENLVEHSRPNDFSNTQATILFDMICLWSGQWGASARGSLQMQHREEQRRRASIPQHIRAADKHLNETQNTPEVRIQNAFWELRNIRRVGFSYSTKILRMLCPKSCGALDSILRRDLGYSETRRGYTAFCTECGRIADELNIQGIISPHPYRREWLVGDVESALYGKLTRG